jgi:predicted site-specific integrase-resolvase
MNRKLWMNPQETAVSLGISVKSIRRWDKAGKLHVARTAGTHARQLERLRVAAAEREYQVGQTIAEYASSLNEKGRGMKNLLSLLEQQAGDVGLIEYPDRLVRFGFSGKRYAYRAHGNPRRKKALPMLVSKSEQEARAA